MGNSDETVFERIRPAVKWGFPIALIVLAFIAGWLLPVAPIPI
jgi:hypothetical protein